MKRELHPGRLLYLQPGAIFFSFIKALHETHIKLDEIKMNLVKNIKR